MTAHQNKTTKFLEDTLNYNSLEEELITKLKEINIGQIIKEELSKNKRFSLYEASPNLLLHFNHGERGISRIHVGFPFPLQSRDYFLSPNHLKMDISLRGESIRSLQRGLLQRGSTEYSEVNDFPNVIKNIRKPERILYVDPYKFIGDSFIGLYFLDSFKDFLGIKETLMFSSQYPHLSAIAPTKDYTPENIAKEIRSGDLVIAPDLIDTHWAKTLQTINEIKDKEVQFAIPGRGLFLEIGKGKIKTAHANEEDTLLRNKNVEDYMADCLKVFGLSGIANFGNPQFHDTYRFFFNPFASQKLRYISPELVFHTYKLLKEKDKRTEFYLIAGYHKNRTHTDWLNNFLTLLKEDGCMRRVGINYYSDLAELTEHLKEKQCSAILSADTSIAHVANRLGYPNITTHNPLWWDANSLQSLSASSPAGFGRYTRNQIPLINDAYSAEEIKDLAKLTTESLLFFQKEPKKQKRIFLSSGACWLKEMYNPERITFGIKDNPLGTFLKSAAIKVSPLHKLENLT